MTEALQKQSKLPPSAYNFSSILAEGGVDFLRPFGQNKYPGVDNDKQEDRSQPPPTSSQSSNSSNNSDEDHHIPDDSPGLTIEDVIDTPNNSTATSPDSTDVYLTDKDGKKIHKATAVRLALNKGFIAKSKDRQMRAAGLDLNLSKVRCFTKPESRSSDMDRVTHNGTFIQGNLFVTLLRSGKTLSLAVLKCTDILEEQTHCGNISMATIRNAEAKITLSGQVLTMKLVAKQIQDPESESEQRLSEWSWIWMGGYCKSKANMRGTNISTEKPIIVKKLSGMLLEPINPDEVQVAGRLTAEDTREINSAGCTYEIDHLALQIVIAELWKLLRAVQFRYRRLSADVLTLRFRRSTFGYPRNTQNGAPQSEPGHW